MIASVSSREADCIESSHWRVVAASAQGSAHISQQKPCQDAFAIRTTDSGWIVAIVADGAGSAEFAEVGAALVVDILATHLVSNLPTESATSSSTLAESFRHILESGIQKARRELAERQLGELVSRGPNDPELTAIIEQRKHDEAGDAIHSRLLRKYHATLVGTVAGPSGGLFFHIGDGAGVATRADNLESYVLSEPRNGDSSEETYFFTERDWKDNLRVADFGAEHDLLVLMSDGAMVFAMAPKLKGLHVPFIAPINKFMRDNWSATAGVALRNTLDSEQSRNLTPDDKTLIWILRRSAA